MTIERMTLNDPEAQSADPVADNIAALKALFPAAVADGRIDFDTLRQLLGDEVDDGDERYGLNWPGKRRARRLALTPSTGTLRPVREDSVDWETTRNLMIEGDNLEVLKLLQKSYSGKINMIYIDPPYNTGKDFVYPDDYADSIGSYLRRSGQTDEDGISNTSNPESSGRFHTNWLNLIYPRLMAARNLLNDNGFIFVSIDYREFGNVKAALDSVMGEDSLVNIFSWVRTRTPASLSQKTKNVAEYILCYEKSDVSQALLGLAKPTQSANTLLNMPNRVSELTFPTSIDMGLPDDTYKAGLYGSATYPVHLINDITVKDGKLTSPMTLLARFRWSQTYLESQLQNGVTVRIATNRFLPSYEKSEYGREAIPNLIDSGVGVGTNENATAELEDLMDERVFSYPKPLSLLRYLVNSSAQNDVVLDFFAGSGTTGHAVMAQNAADGGNRQYILVQLPEALDPTNKEQQLASEYCEKIGRDTNIAELTKERLRRAGKKIRHDYPDTEADLGFRVYKLASSNLRPWEPGDDLAADLLTAADNIVQGRTEDDLLTELLLKQGIDLTEPMVTANIAGAPVHAMGGGVLVACLAPITAAGAEALADGIADWIERLNPVSAATIFFKDAGFENDVAKANVTAILDQRLDDKLLKVRSL